MVTFRLVRVMSGGYIEKERECVFVWERAMFIHSRELNFLNKQINKCKRPAHFDVITEFLRPLFILDPNFGIVWFELLKVQNSVLYISKWQVQVIFVHVVEKVQTFCTCGFVILVFWQNCCKMSENVRIKSLLEISFQSTKLTKTNTCTKMNETIS